MVGGAGRSRIIDVALLGFVVIAAAWLGRLVHHNYFGGHVALEFADWTVPVPEGVRIVEYRATPPEERTQRIDLMEELREYVGLETQVTVESLMSTKRPASVPRPYALFAVSRSGDLYVSRADEYQVLALDSNAEPKWAMRTTYVPQAVDEALVERALETARQRRPETMRDDLIWPDRLPALSHIAVDGHGHVYVYPYFAAQETIEDRPVDVYSPDGELLFSGMIEDRLWRRGEGDLVYASGSDRLTGETLVWRWKLVEPF